MGILSGETFIWILNIADSGVDRRFFPEQLKDCEECLDFRENQAGLENKGRG
jgi:hypothetical protein